MENIYGHKIIAKLPDGAPDPIRKVEDNINESVRGRKKKRIEQLCDRQQTGKNRKKQIS
jgi:hypothetical protein